MKIANEIVEEYYLELTEDQAMKTRLASVIAAKLGRVREIADKLACWNEGQVVTGAFDDPRSARAGREIIQILDDRDRAIEEDE